MTHQYKCQLGRNANIDGEEATRRCKLKSKYRHRADLRLPPSLKTGSIALRRASLRVVPLPAGGPSAGAVKIAVRVPRRV